jgi:hypothetical protein
MFIDRLHSYLNEENALRRRDDRVALALSVLVSAILLMLGSTTQTAALFGSTSLIAYVGYSTFKFCAFSESKRETRHRLRAESGPLYLPVSRRAALVAISGAAIVLIAPEAGATILDRRLKTLTASVPLNRESLRQIADTLDAANRYKIRLKSESLREVVGALQKTSYISPALARDAVSVGSKAAALSTLDLPIPSDLQGKIFSSLPEAKGSMWAFWPIASNTGPDNYQTIGLAAYPDMAEMWHVDTSPPEAKYGPAFLVVKGLQATIDGFFLKHVAFQDMNLLYNGGPLNLDEVYFINCRFQFDVSSVSSLSLLSQVVKGGWVSFSNAPEA